MSDVCRGEEGGNAVGLQGAGCCSAAGPSTWARLSPAGLRRLHQECPLPGFSLHDQMQHSNAPPTLKSLCPALSPCGLRTLGAQGGESSHVCVCAGLGPGESEWDLRAAHRWPLRRPCPAPGRLPQSKDNKAAD